MRWLLVLAAFMFAVRTHAEAVFVPLDFLPGSVSGVSADGSTVFGSSGVEAFLWTKAGGIQDLGALPGATDTWATAISVDGTFVVGISGDRYTSSIDDDWNLIEEARFQGFRSTRLGGIEDLGALPSATDTRATAISADGSTVVGQSGYSRLYPSPGYDGSYTAFRWTQAGGIQSLGEPLDATDSRATAVSADGTVVVGSSGDGAFRWTQESGMQDLGHLPGATTTIATAISANGATIVGSSDNKAFRWTPADGIQDLGAWPNATLTRATAISADGETIVGYSGTTEIFSAFRWTHTGGLQYPTGSPFPNHNTIATHLSADGSKVVGYSEQELVPGYNEKVVIRWTYSNEQVVGPIGTGVVPTGVSANGEIIVGTDWLVELPEPGGADLAALVSVLGFAAIRKHTGLRKPLRKQQSR